MDLRLAVLVGFASLAASRVASPQSCVDLPGGCPGTGLASPACVGAPTIGNSAFAVLPSACAGGTFRWLILGTCTAPTPLPPLAPMCTAGCTLRATLFFLFSGASPLGAITIPIPPIPSLIGGQVSTQTVCIDLGAGCAVLSPAEQIIVG